MSRGPQGWETWLENQGREGNGTAGPGVHWRNLLQKSPSTGTAITNLWNTLLALRNDPRWAGKFRWDEMLQTQIGPQGPIEDSHIIPIHEWLQENGLTRIGLDVVREAIEGVCREHPFHPLKDELKQCHAAWDGVARLPTWTQTYLGCAPGDPNTSIGVMFLVAMIKRIFEPGCQSDYMLVLEGPQGKQKSKACAILAGDYFSDDLPDLASDYIRVQMHLRGKWLIEVAELSSFSKPDAAKLKSFLTTKVEQYTPKFARNEVRQPRTCLFVGTTNEDTYLRDPSGGRRFWPLKCGEISLDKLERDRDLLLGEAVDEYRAGTLPYPEDKFEDEHLKPLQESRYEGDAWEDIIAEKLIGVKETSTALIAHQYLGIPDERIGTIPARRIAAIMRRLNWRMDRSNQKRLWVPS